MADDDEVIVNLQGDTSTTQVVKVEGDTTTNLSFNEGGGEDDPVADLKKQFSAMTTELRTVSAAAADAQQRLESTEQRLANTVVTSQIDTIESGIAAAEAEARAAEQDYAAAFEAGDGARMARAQRAMARAETHLQRLGEARDDLKERAQTAPASQQQTRQQPSQPRQQASDPVERVAATMSPKSAAWIRAHPECITDPKMNARMMAAHNLALADDIAVDSPEYFQRIEEGIKVRKAAQEPKPANNGQGDGRRPSSGAASGGATGGGLNGGTTTVKLTPGEAKSATDGTLVWNYDDPTGQNRFKKGEPIGLAEMARRKHEGMKQGLYDKNNFQA